ncbi:MAG: STAS domain-containing protein [Pseudonocardia sediminis]
MTQDRSCLIVRTTRLRPRVRLITVGGEIDLTTTPELVSALTCVGDASADVVVDLGVVTFLGACGVGVLAEARGRALSAGTPFRVAADESTVAGRTLACCGWAGDRPGHGAATGGSTTVDSTTTGSTTGGHPATESVRALVREMARQRDRVAASLERHHLGPGPRCGVCAVLTTGRRLRMSPTAVRCHDHLVSRA